MKTHTMIKAIIFDVGGTYMSGRVDTFVNGAFKILGIKKIFKSDRQVIFDEKLNKGSMDIEECFKSYFAVSIDDDQMNKIKQLWTTTWAPTKTMIKLIKSLGKSYRLAILSNSDHLNAQMFRKKGWYSYFDTLILSHEIGIIKPDPAIYAFTLKKLGLPASQCLFIDDQQSVLPPANELGMETIHFKSIRQLKNELRRRKIEF